MLRVAVYNVENLFDRAKIMNQDEWKDGRSVLNNFSKLNILLDKSVYSAPDKKKMINLMQALGIDRNDRGPYVILRQNRGTLTKRPKSGGVSIEASGRSDWIGSLELIETPIKVAAIRNTAEVIKEIQADILGVVEAESRPALRNFCDELLATPSKKTPYQRIMLIDGNDERGIDVGILAKKDYPIFEMRSHVDDLDSRGRRVFSRDCPEFSIALPGGESILVLVNHFKSKGFGAPAESDARRKKQATRVAELYKQRVKEGIRNVIIMGDLNDTPDSSPLSPLLKSTNLKDVFLHPKFDDGGYPGTFGLCNAGNKIDYLLLSPSLYKLVANGGVVRSGMWPGSRPVRWKSLNTLKNKIDVASDHAAVWVDLQL